MADLRGLIGEIPDFPKPGILFRDITPLLADGPALATAVERLAAPWLGSGLDAVVAVRVPFGEDLALTASASAGAERAHVGFVPGGGALAGGVAVGVQWRP